MWDSLCCGICFKKAKNAKLTAGFKTASAGVTTGKKWADLCKEHLTGKQGKAWDDAYLALQKQYSAEYNEYKQSKSNYKF